MAGKKHAAGTAILMHQQRAPHLLFARNAAINSRQTPSEEIHF
jgi:hypothetical protein